MKPNSIKHTRQNCQGMTLIEVLVAAVVIAIGLMGVAALQVTALQGASNADYRSKAIDYAAALSDRMHANLMAFEDEGEFNGLYDNTYMPAIPVDCAVPPAAICAMDPTMPDASGINDCNPAQMATFDLWKFSCDDGVQSSLPGGQLTVTCLDNDVSDADTCSDLSPMLITITWQLQSDNNATDEVIMTVVPGAP
ncbi:MAG: type IV pilus modification protein PilV [Candidatus Thiodiazotropha sp.]|nr:type IV pilus modification protein PilV [Candidatus Thiodiazotropha sp.]MCM8883918.1 type IV pilus modification protein PilV [Candidatus Thiodiazotropha sp.]MCM8920839.1 type IV pilus modification protein PilV [Candidatus Thiodiazotropha sp.]